MFSVLLKLDGEASEADELRDIRRDRVKGTVIEGEEDELEIGQPCEGKRSGPYEVKRRETHRKENKLNTNGKNEE